MELEWISSSRDITWKTYGRNSAGRRQRRRRRRESVTGSISTRTGQRGGASPWTSFCRISVKTGKSASSKLLTVAALALQVMRMDRHSDSNR